MYVNVCLSIVSAALTFEGSADGNGIMWTVRSLQSAIYGYQLFH